MIRQQLLLLFSLLTTLAYAQPYVGKLGQFQVDQIKGCAPFTVTATSLVDCGGACAYDFLGNGLNGSTDDFIAGSSASFTYSTPGKFKLMFCSANNCVTKDEIEIEIVANIAPEFDIYTCNSNAVQVKVVDTNYNQYVINYSDGSSSTVPSGSLAKDNHTFTDGSGAKTIGIRGRNLNAADNCTTNTKSFTAVASIPAPAINSLRTISETALDLQYTLPQNVLGRLDIGINNNSTFQQIKNAYEDVRDTIQNLNNATNFYCFRIGAVDACTNTASYASATVCSIVFAATAKDGFNQLDWNTNSTGMANYSLLRDQNTYLLNIPAAGRTLNDIDVLCNETYCYQLIANYPGGATSTSVEKCVTSFTTQKPPALTDINATYNEASTIEVSWTNALTAEEYSIYKSLAGAPFTLYTSISSTPFIDTQTSLTSPSCYRIPYQDACNNFTENDLDVCPVFLSATVSTDNKVSLSWTDYQGWSGGVAAYRLEKYSQTGARLRVYPPSTSTSFLDEENDLVNQVTTYKVFVLPVDGTLPTVNSNTLEVIRRPNLFYPTSFTPDKQGPVENEVFKVYGQYVASFELEIFNRWGELMFTSNDFETGWDGTFRGVDQPDGTYAFVARLTDYAGRTSKSTGSVVLLRKQ